MLHACIDCGTLTSESRCPEHQGTKRNGSTRAWREVRAEVLKRDHYRCFYCGAPATTVDHLHPVSRGGAELDPENCVASCAGCNGSKGEMTAEEFGCEASSAGADLDRARLRHRQASPTPLSDLSDRTGSRPRRGFAGRQGDEPDR